MLQRTLLLAAFSLVEAVPGPSFGTVMKGCYRAPAPGVPEAQQDRTPWPAERELPVFAHECAAAGGACAMHHLWVGGNWAGYEEVRVRYYVDGEVNASIAFEPGMAAGTGFDDPAGSTTKHHGDAPVEAPAWGVSAASKQSLPCL